MLSEGGTSRAGRGAKRFPGKPRQVLATLALVGGHVTSLGACVEADKSAVPPAHEVALAVGAFYPVTIADACRGGQGKLDFCQQENLVRIDRVTASPSGFVEVRPINDVPAAMRESGVDWVVAGVAPGLTTLTIEGTFDDGSTRSTNIKILTARATRATAEISCTNPMRFPAGHSMTFRIKLFARPSLELGGALPGVLAGPGLSVVAGLRGNAYTWQAPQSSGDVTYQSPVPGFEPVLGSYLPDDVTILDGRLDTSRISPASLLTILIRSEVRGSAPCQPMPLAVTTLTPEVCTGRDGETSWEELPRGDIRTRPLTSGTCRLNVGAVGSTKRKEIAVTYQFPP